MSMIQDRTRALAKRFVERSTAMGYKGKQRDHAALDFLTGAATQADISGDKAMAEHLALICVMVVSVRGFFGVKQLAEDSLPVLEHPNPRIVA